jgi:protein O-GlcNAc transferase
MQSKASADVFLDTWEFGGHTTSVDSLWAGVPVLTFAGPSLMSRVSSSLLIHLGQTSAPFRICVFKPCLLLTFRFAS